MSIQILSDEVVSRIAAGEVVERPASVVKELIENSLDAGATHIHIEANGGGRQLIRISDDGSGIFADEVELAFTRHATSKLHHADDLVSIQTLGFRGEALASIASVSRLSVTTRHRDEKIGTQLKIEGGKFRQKQGVGAPAGTVLSIENLFFNTPARLKFLKVENTEKRHIFNVVTRYAMAYPQVRFVLAQDGREVFRSSGNGQLSDVVMNVFGLDIFKRMVEVNEEVKSGQGLKIKVVGYVSEPNLDRTDRARIVLFVNGRAIQDNSLTHAVSQAYHTLMTEGRHPYAVLMLGMPTDFVDVNVHPTKAEVRFQDSNVVFVAVQKAVRSAVIDLVALQQQSRIVSTPFERREWDYQSLSRTDEQLGLDWRVESPGRFPEKSVIAPQGDNISVDGIPYGPGVPQKPRTLPVLRVVGQVGARYIIAEGPAGVYLIDQSAAHERILFEQFTEMFENRQIDIQQLEEGSPLELPPDEARWMAKNLDHWISLGFALEIFGPNTFIIRSIPALIGNRDATDLIALVAHGATVQKSKDDDAIESYIIALISQAIAVKSGQILSRDEMQNIVRQLERCQTPLNAPSGGPTMLHMSAEQLAREFGR